MDQVTQLYMRAVFCSLADAFLRHEAFGKVALGQRVVLTDAQTGMPGVMTVTVDITRARKPRTILEKVVQGTAKGKPLRVGLE